MPQLLRKPFGAHGKVHEITPTSAGWRYVGFSLYRLRAGETAAEVTGSNEVILVMVEGKASFRAAGRDTDDRPVLGQALDDIAADKSGAAEDRHDLAAHGIFPLGDQAPHPRIRPASGPAPTAALSS